MFSMMFSMFQPVTTSCDAGIFPRWTWPCVERYNHCKWPSLGETRCADVSWCFFDALSMQYLYHSLSLEWFRTVHSSTGFRTDLWEVLVQLKHTKWKTKDLCKGRWSMTIKSKLERENEFARVDGTWWHKLSSWRKATNRLWKIFLIKEKMLKIEHAPRLLVVRITTTQYSHCCTMVNVRSRTIASPVRRSTLVWQLVDSHHSMGSTVTQLVKKQNWYGI